MTISGWLNSVNIYKSTSPVWWVNLIKACRYHLQGESIPEGPVPEDATDKQISFVTPVILDLPEIKRHFGDCLVQPQNEYHIGDTVTVQFVCCKKNTLYK